MNLITLDSPTYLTTRMGNSILTLAHLLNIGIDTPFNTRVPYMYLVVDEVTHRLIQISSDYSADADVEVSSKVFSEIIMDIASGIPINDAMLKHNILVGY